MEKEKIKIKVGTIVNAPIAVVWEKWVSPNDVVKWNNASDDWHTPAAENNFSIGGQFKYTMAAKDGSMSFDFGGVYKNIIRHKLIEYEMGDGRNVLIEFSSHGTDVQITEIFEAETENSIELQQQGWQAILNNFKKYTESNLLRTEKL